MVLLSIIPFSWALVRNLNITLPIQAVRTVVLGDPISLPVNFSKINDSIPNNIPSKIEFVPIDQPEYINQISDVNLKVWIEYLDIIYSQSEYPRDETSVLRVRARDNSIEVLGIESLVF